MVYFKRQLPARLRCHRSPGGQDGEGDRRTYTIPLFISSAATTQVSSAKGAPLRAARLGRHMANKAWGRDATVSSRNSPSNTQISITFVSKLFGYIRKLYLRKARAHPDCMFSILKAQYRWSYCSLRLHTMNLQRQLLLPCLPRTLKLPWLRQESFLPLLREVLRGYSYFQTSHCFNTHYSFSPFCYYPKDAVSQKSADPNTSSRCVSIKLIAESWTETPLPASLPHLQAPAPAVIRRLSAQG